MNVDGDLIKEVLLKCEDVAIEYGDIGLSELLEGSVIEEIPILKTFNSVIKIGNNISSAFFYKKLLNFLINLKEFNYEEREKIINKYTKDDKEFSEKLIYIIEKLDETEKAKFLSNIFKCYGEEKIDYNTFRRFCIILTNVYINDIKFLNDNIGKQFGGISAMALINSGLVVQNIIDANLESGEGEVYFATPIGEKFCKCIFYRY